MTELEHFIKREDVETIVRVCSIAITIKPEDKEPWHIPNLLED